jgi:hypothetical protein
MYRYATEYRSLLFVNGRSLRVLGRLLLGL